MMPPRQSLYIDTNVVTKLGSERPDLLRILHAAINRQQVLVVPASIMHIAECLQTPDPCRRQDDLTRLHALTDGTIAESHNDVLRSYVKARLVGAPTARTTCRTWGVAGVLDDRDSRLAAHHEWIKQDLEWVRSQQTVLEEHGVGGHAGNAIDAAAILCADIVRGLPNRPHKIREFLEPAMESMALSDDDARLLSQDSWLQLVYALRLFPAVHACFTKAPVSESRYRGDLGDWHHAVFARTATWAVSDDGALVTRWRRLSSLLGMRSALLSWRDDFESWLTATQDSGPA